MTKIPSLVAETVPELLIPPEKVGSEMTKRPSAPDDIVPVLLMPPEKLETPPTTMASPTVVILPELLMPPEKVEASTAMPAKTGANILMPARDAVMVPALLTLPLTEALLLMTMPVSVGLPKKPVAL